MLNFINAYLNPIDSKLSKSFLNDIIHFLQIKLKIQKNQINYVTVFYNHITICCIIRVKFNSQFAKELPDDVFYFLTNCTQSDIILYGQSLQDAICYNGNKITWISQNKILKFYPDKKITKTLNKKMKN